MIHGIARMIRKNVVARFCSGLIVGFVGDWVHLSPSVLFCGVRLKTAGQPNPRLGGGLPSQVNNLSPHGDH